MLSRNQKLSPIPSIHDPILCRTMFFFQPKKIDRQWLGYGIHTVPSICNSIMYEPMFSDMMQSGIHSQVSTEESLQYLPNSLRCDQIKTSRVRLVPCPNPIRLVTHEEVAWCGCHLARLSLNSRLCAEIFFQKKDCAQRTNSLPAAAVRHHPLRVELKYSTTIIGSTGAGGGRLGL
jgi:hypothetical protein